jgi:aminopeptidase N
MVGMETQTMITLSSRVPADDLLHEFAHQWFGDAVTPTTWTDLWLNEGWAMYAQYQYDGTDLEESLREADAKLRARLGPPGHPRADSFAESNVYICPAAMLKELNDALGDQKFFAMATAWVQTQKDTQQDRASFLAFVNKFTGKDFTKLINAWLDSPTTPANQ